MYWEGSVIEYNPNIKETEYNIGKNVHMCCSNLHTCLNTWTSTIFFLISRSVDVKRKKVQTKRTYTSCSNCRTPVYLQQNILSVPVHNLNHKEAQAQRIIVQQRWVYKSRGIYNNIYIYNLEKNHMTIKSLLNGCSMHIFFLNVIVP